MGIIVGTESLAKAKKKLTAAFVRAIKFPGKYYDDSGQGLFLLVSKSMSKSWVQRIHVNGKRSDIGLGSADLVSLADARDLALSNRQMAKRGINPIAEKRTKDIPIFSKATKEVHRQHAPTWKNKKHSQQFINTLTTYAFPVIGHKLVSDISSSDILRILSPIWIAKAETARRVKQRISTVLRWCVAQNWRSDDPTLAIAQALPKQHKTLQNRKALPYQEVATCLNHVQTSSESGPRTKLAFEFLIRTAARSTEIRHATWDEINFNNREWLIPAEKMKSNNEHRVPLSDQAFELIKQAESFKDGSNLIFAGVRYGKPMSDATLLKLVKSKGYNIDIHGFRTSFRTWAQEQTDFPREVIEKALAHSIQSKTEAAYARSDLFEKRRELMNSWCDFIDEGLKTAATEGKSWKDFSFDMIEAENRGELHSEQKDQLLVAQAIKFLKQRHTKK